MRTLLLTLWWCAFGCAPAPATVGVREQAILGGAADAASNNVFLLDLRFDTGASICSAVAISPRVLLTAAHCVDPVFHNATTLSVRATNKANTVMLMQSDMIDVTAIARHPSWNPAVQESDFDFAAILLERAPTGVTAAPLLTALPANAASQPLRVVGYGRASASDGTSSGTRRSVTVPITAITSADLRFGSNGAAGICAGDSGGPSFLGEAVAGIHSRTEGASCGVGVDIRVDRHAAFINAFVAANDPPSCANDGRCALGCGTSDPDCPCQAEGRCDASCGLTDPDCSDDGSVCTLGAQCAGGLCLDDPRGFQFCSRACTNSSECLNEMTCQAEACRAAPESTQTDPVAGGCATAPACLAWLLLLLLRQSKTRASRAGLGAPGAESAQARFSPDGCGAARRRR